MRQTPNILEVQECGWGPLSPCQVWWGSDFTRGGSAKNVEFSVCLSRFWTCSEKLAHSRTTELRHPPVSNYQP